MAKIYPKYYENAKIRMHECLLEVSPDTVTRIHLSTFNDLVMGSGLIGIDEFINLLYKCTELKFTVQQGPTREWVDLTLR